MPDIEPDSGSVGILHPGEMGAAVAACLHRRGFRVCWASAGRSRATKERADAAGLADAGSVAAVLRDADVLLSVCPPHAAESTAAEATGFTGIYVDANAVAPEAARRIAGMLPDATFVDGGIVGNPPTAAGTTRLYLSGDAAGTVRELFAGTPVDARVVPGGVGAASAVKAAYAAWTKGSAALLLTARELARAEGVEATLLDEWTESLPDLHERVATAERSATAKGWRWVGEMEEIAAAMRAAGLPAGFHAAAAEVYRDRPRPAL
jgi:3-hydroxyisobutyrate dehydrogenase-like beta-hydroxyacid dehydrogenase